MARAEFHGQIAACWWHMVNGQKKRVARVLLLSSAVQTMHRAALFSVAGQRPHELGSRIKALSLLWLHSAG